MTWNNLKVKKIEDLQIVVRLYNEIIKKKMRSLYAKICKFKLKIVEVKKTWENGKYSVIWFLKQKQESHVKYTCKNMLIFPKENKAKQ